MDDLDEQARSKLMWKLIDEKRDFYEKGRVAVRLAKANANDTLEEEREKIIEELQCRKS